MSQDPSPGRGSSLSIGDVVAQLTDEFPDLTVSKVRYLEGEGLILPQRTARGSRRYSSADVEHIRRILRLQRDQFLPLRVIRESLAEEPATAADVARTSVRRGRVTPLSRAELCQLSGIDKPLLAELERYGLVTDYDSVALQVCSIVVRLREFGVEARHLRAFRVAADREIGLAEQVLAPHRTVAERDRGTAHGRAERFLSLCIDLHVALVRARIPD